MQHVNLYFPIFGLAVKWSVSIQGHHLNTLDSTCTRVLDAAYLYDILFQAREARNSLMHNSSMMISNKIFQSIAQSLIDLLEDPKHLAKRQETQAAVKEIKEVIYRTLFLGLIVGVVGWCDGTDAG